MQRDKTHMRCDTGSDPEWDYCNGTHPSVTQEYIRNMPTYNTLTSVSRPRIECDSLHVNTVSLRDP